MGLPGDGGVFQATQVFDRRALLEQCIELAKQREFLFEVRILVQASREMRPRTLNQRSVVSIPIYESVARGGADRGCGQRGLGRRLAEEIAERPAQIPAHDKQRLIELVRQPDDHVAIEIACCEFEICVRYARMTCCRGTGLGIEFRNATEYSGHVVVEK